MRQEGGRRTRDLFERCFQSPWVWFVCTDLLSSEDEREWGIEGDRWVSALVSFMSFGFQQLMRAVETLVVHVGENDERKVLLQPVQGLDGVFKGLPCGDGSPEALSLTFWWMEETMSSWATAVDDPIPSPSSSVAAAVPSRPIFTSA